MEKYRKIAMSLKKPVCEICGKKRWWKYLVIHHKDVDHFNDNINNLMVMCRTCHTKMPFHAASKQKLPIQKRKSDNKVPSDTEIQRFIDIFMDRHTIQRDPLFVDHKISCAFLHDVLYVSSSFLAHKYGRTRTIIHRWINLGRNDIRDYFNYRRDW
jgi:hypothetical protein